jgi:hypothetical protein
VGDEVGANSQDPWRQGLYFGDRRGFGRAEHGNEQQ